MLGLRDRGPFWLGTNSDPSYAYALNSLRLLEGEAPTHLDHPGLTTHLFGAAAFTATHRLASPPTPMTEDVLARPEWYLATTVRTRLVLFGAALVGLGRAVLRATGNWTLVWVAQAGPLLSPSVLFELTDFKPEPFLYLFAVLLATAVCGALASVRPVDTARAATLGLLVGLAVASKLTALPLIVCPLILLRTWRSRVVCCLSAAAALLLCALPALPNWRRAAAFVWRLASGSGLYGMGLHAAERPYGREWARIVIEEAPFFIVLAVAVAAMSLAWRQRERPAVAPSFRAVLALSGACVAQLAIVAFHPYQPRYLVSALGLAGALLALSSRTLGLADVLGPWRGALAAAVVVVALACVQLPRFVRRQTQLAAATQCQLQVRAHAESSGCRIATYYRASSPALALFLGDTFAGRSFRARLRPRFPDEVFVGADGRGWGFAGAVDLEESPQRCLVLHGSPGGPRHPLGPPSDAPFAGLAGLSSVRPVFSCGWEAAFVR